MMECKLWPEIKARRLLLSAVELQLKARTGQMWSCKPHNQNFDFGGRIIGVAGVLKGRNSEARAAWKRPSWPQNLPCLPAEDRSDLRLLGYQGFKASRWGLHHICCNIETKSKLTLLTHANKGDSEGADNLQTSSRKKHRVMHMVKCHCWHLSSWWEILSP